jgi:hypothetical protein
MYAAGWFTAIGGANRNYIAALDLPTGAASAWNPGANNYVHALAVAGQAVYAGGEFTKIGGQARNRIAALDVRTAVAAIWPSANGDVYSLAAGGSTVYVGGEFKGIGGLPQSNVAAIAAAPVVPGSGANPGLALEGAHPNPTSGAPVVFFTLRSSECATLDLMDIAGRRVLRREVGSLGPGRHLVTLDSSHLLRPGVYFLRLAQGGRMLHARVAVIR